MVPRETAERVAEEEKTAREHALDGVYGQKEKDRAEAQGLGGIVEEVWEQRGKLHYRDVITSETGIKQHRTKGH